MTFVLDTAQESFDLMLSIGAGTGLLYLLRWFWWRINAWSEIAAMVELVRRRRSASSSPRKNGIDDRARTSSLLVTVARHDGRLGRRDVPRRRRPTDATLVRFYQLVRPGRAGLGRDPRARPALAASPDSAAAALLGWVLGCAFVYSALFGTGSFLYGGCPQGMVWLVVFLASAGGLARLLPRMWAARSEA